MSAIPRVTVLTTVHDGQRFLDEAIESVLSQDYRDFEYVIVDDGSKDGTPSIIERWARKDARIVPLRLPKNRGVGFAANRGLELCRGEYIARLDADDITLPGRFAKQIDALDRTPSLALVSTFYDVMDERGMSRTTLAHHEEPPILGYLANFTNPLGAHSPAMFRREAAMAIGGYCEEHAPAADYDFIARIGRSMAVLPFVGVRYRIHATQITATQRMPQRQRVLEIARQRLSTFLQREVSFDEINAVRSVFGWSMAPSRAELAQRVLEEAFARFRERHEEHASRVCAITSTRWLRSATREREKLARLRYAWMWRRQ